MSAFMFQSAYEVQSGDTNNTGATQFLELNAFHATHNRSHEDVGHVANFPDFLT